MIAAEVRAEYSLIPTTRRGEILLERRTIPARDGLLGLVQTFKGSDTRTLITHRAFVLARVEVLDGNLSFPLYSETIQAPKRFLLALPPRSVLPMAFDRANVYSEGVAGFSYPSITRPMLLACNLNDTLIDIEAVRRALRGSVLKQFDADTCVEPVIVRARKLLHELIAHPAPLRTAAKCVGIRSETLCRGFSNAYKLTPKQYCHRARLFEAVLCLMSGCTILESALVAGFGDVKRFYVQFKRLLGTTPGPYVQVKKRQDIDPNNLL